MQQPILFRQAEAQDVAACWLIVDDARNNMMAEGKQQWDEHYPTRAIIEQDIAAHCPLVDAGKIWRYPSFGHCFAGTWTRFGQAILCRV